tara:strand:- start:579 stop:740 length:162 start_codon:yes stop_codon:yes gene_type:complete
MSNKEVKRIDEDKEKVIQYLKETGVWASLRNENSSWFHIAPNTLIDLIKGYEQ